MKMSIWARDHGRFSAMMAIAIFEWCCFNGWIFWVTLYYQNYMGFTPMQTVVRLLPMSVSGILCNLFVGFFISRIRLFYILVAGMLATSTSTLLFALINPDSSYWAFGFPAATLTVVGADFIFSAGIIYVARVSSADEQSVAGGLFNTMIQLGTAIGITVSTVVFNSVTAKRDADADRLASYHASQWMSLAFGLLGTIIAAACFYNIGIIGDKATKLEKESEFDAESAKSLEVLDHDDAHPSTLATTKKI